MNRQDYKEAAERLLTRAEKATEGGMTPHAIEIVGALTGLARVHAMLAAIPDVQDKIAQDDELRSYRRPRTSHLVDTDEGE